MGKYFGTDGFRGEANVDITGNEAYKIGRFLGWYYNELNKINGKDTSAKIVIGKDTRRSSYMFEYTLAAGITASGADVFLLHVTTTPSVAYITKADGFDLGVMISASHNPYYDNGIKLMNGEGEKLEDEVINYIEDYMDGNLEVFGKKWEEVPYGTGENIGKTVDYVAGRNRYMAYLISLGMYSFKGIKVGLDCSNGSAFNMAPSIFQALGAKTVVINEKPNGTNINENAGSTHIEQLQKLVIQEGLDIGFAYDGDGDRCLAVDEKGNILTGDHILYAYGKYLKEKGMLYKDTVVTTIMSNFGLYKALDDLGINYTKTAVGDKYVYENMAEHGYSFGGEQSGHIIISEYASTGDGILTSLKLMEVMKSKNLPMSKILEDFHMFPQKVANVSVHNKTKASQDVDVNLEVEKIQKLLGDTGRALLRESGTEPVVRVMVEAESEEICQKYVEQILKVLEKKDHIKEKKSNVNIEMIFEKL